MKFLFRETPMLWNLDFMKFRFREIRISWNSDFMKLTFHKFRFHEIQISWNSDFMVGYCGSPTESSTRESYRRVTTVEVLLPSRFLFIERRQPKARSSMYYSRQSLRDHKGKTDSTNKKRSTAKVTAALMLLQLLCVFGTRYRIKCRDTKD